MNVRPVRVTVWLVTGLALLVASPGAAQTTLRSMHLSADLSPADGGADVEVDYVLVVERGSALRFELLGFGLATTDAFRLDQDGTVTPITLEVESGSRRTAALTPDVSGTGSELRFVGHYRIANAVERNGTSVRVHVPVLRLAIPPEDGVPDLFTAAVRLPEGWAISESFPSGLRADEDGRHVVSLAVAPSVVTVRARSDGTWRPGLPFVLELIAVTVVLAFGLIGWRHLRRIAADPQKGAAGP